MKTRLNEVGKKVERVSRAVRKDVTQRLRVATRASQPKQVVFVAGVQRSGTNMMVGALERSLETQVYREVDPRAYEHFELRSRDVIQGLVRTSRASHVAFKALCDLQELRQLLDDFTPAKGVWMLRDLDDCVNSQIARWKARWLPAIVEDRNGAAWRGRGMSDATHALVKKHYRPDLDNASAWALFWYLRNVLFFDQELERDPRVRLVPYEPLVLDPGRQFPPVFAFLGIDYSPAIAAGVFSDSVRKRPAPHIEPAIRELCTALRARFDAVQVPQR